MSVTFSRRLPSRLELMSPLADEIAQFLEAHVPDDELSYRALLLASEATTNAVEHGNALDPNLHADLEIKVTGSGITISVEDEGPGFDPSEAPDAVQDDDPLSARHRGLFLMRAYADVVKFEKGGRRVVLHLARD